MTYLTTLNIRGITKYNIRIEALIRRAKYSKLLFQSDVGLGQPYFSKRNLGNDPLTQNQSLAAWRKSGDGFD